MRLPENLIRRRSTALLFLSCFCPTVFCPTVIEAQADAIRFEHLSLEQGLSESTVNCILQDVTGFLWMGTQDGLNRYDGYGFEIFRNDPADPATLSHDWIQALLEDPSGDLWVGTRGGGLSRWRRDIDAFVSYRHDPQDPESLSGDRVWVIVRDRSGFLWLGTDSGLNRFDPASGRFRRFVHDPTDPASLSADAVRTILEDRAGRLWVGTSSGLDLFDPAIGGVRRHFRKAPGDPSSLSDDRVRSLLEDGDGGLWVGTHMGLDRLDPATGKVTRFRDSASPLSRLDGDVVRALFAAEDGRLWIGTDDGLNLWQSHSEVLTVYRHEPADLSSLSSDRVVAVTRDRGGILWAGTQGGGINKWNLSHRSFQHYRAWSPAGAGTGKLVFAFSEDRAGRLWIGSLGGGLSRLDRAHGEVIQFLPEPGNPRSLPDDKVTALHHDRHGRLWVGTVAGGLALFDAATETFERFRHDPEDPGSLSLDAVTTIFEDRRGALWIGTHGGGVNQLDAPASDRPTAETAAFRRFRHDPADPHSLSNDRVSSLAETASGLWLATEGGGLNRFDGDRFSSFRTDPADPGTLSSDALTVLYTDVDGVLYCGTQGRGLDKLVSFDPGSGDAVFENYSARDGLPNETVWGIEADDSGNLWLSTNNGLSRFDPTSRTFKNYDVSYGLQSNEFNMGAHFKSSSGELFFGGVNGFNAFYPDRIRENDSVPPIVLTRFSKLNQEVHFERPIFDVEDITLSYRDAFFSFEFAALDYAAPEKNRYRFWLDGFHPDWIDVGDLRRADFTNLDPGRYVFRVQGSNNDGVWNRDGLRIGLTVQPPWWQTWWARLAALFAMASIVLAVYRVRVRSIRKINEQLRRLVAERTHELERAQERLLRQERLAALGEVAGSVAHEIRNPLGAMKNSIFMLRQGLESEKPETVQDLKLLERQIRQVNRIISELLDFARHRPAEREHFSLASVTEQVLGAHETPGNVDVETHCEAGLIVEADLGQIEQILTNLYSNAIEAMPEGGKLEVTCRRRGEDAVASFVDAGIGIAPQEISKIFEPLYTSKAQGIGLGLALSERYARLNRGRIECESELGKGAAFRLVLPIAGGSDPEARNPATAG